MECLSAITGTRSLGFAVDDFALPLKKDLRHIGG
jgi:hypothetical protein